MFEILIYQHRKTERFGDSIIAAMKRGDFYASNGVILKTVDSGQDTYTVEIDLYATKEQLRSPYLSGNITGSGVPGFLIEFR